MFGNVSDALQWFKTGGLVLVADDENRENEVDMIMAAELATEEHVNTMLRHGTGIICCPMDRATATDLGLSYMINPEQSSDPKGTAFTYSVDSKACHTGVSAADRLLTIRALCDHQPLSCPGHMFPLIAHQNLLQGRQGHTEASVTMCKLAKTKRSIAVIVEAMNPDGTMMRVKDIPPEWPYPVINIDQLKAYVESEPEIISFMHEPGVEFEIAECDLTVRLDDEKKSAVDGKFYTLRAPLHSHAKEYCVFVYPTLAVLRAQETQLIRLHSECMTGNVFHSCHCDCHEQFEQAMHEIVRNGSGAVMYVPGHEGRGIGLFAKTLAYKVQKEYGMDTYAANGLLGFREDQRDYAEPIRALHFLCDTKKARCITNNDDKVVAMQAAGIDTTRMNIFSHASPHNEKYLMTKQERNKAKVFYRGSKPERALREKKRRVLIVASCWNQNYVDQLIEEVRGVVEKTCAVEVRRVPGAWEIPYAVSRHACSGVYDAIIAIGVLIKGGTKHFEYIAKNVFGGLMECQLRDRACPVINGVLTVLDVAQIEERIELGKTWGISALEMMDYTEKI